MEIPTNKTPTNTKLGNQVIAVYGQAKIGKSTFASQFPNALFAATEPGLNFLEVYQVTINTWGDFRDLCNALAKDPKHVETLVIDTVDLLYAHCEAHVCADNKVTHPSQGNHGLVWSKLKTEFNRVLTKLTMLRTASGEPMGLVMISHDRVVEEDTRTGVKRYSAPDLSNSPRTIVEAKADLLLFADTEQDGSRVFRTTPNDKWRGGDRSGFLSETMPLNYNAIVEAFGKGESNE